MAKKKSASKNAKKESVKAPVVTTKVETTPVTPDKETVSKEIEKVETPVTKAEPVKDTSKVETKTEQKKEEPKKEVPKKEASKKPIPKKEVEKEVVETVVPEVVETKADKSVKVKTKDEGPKTVGEGLFERALENNDRISNDSGIKLMDMFKSEFMDDPKLDNAKREALRQQYRGVLLAQMLCYSAQVNNDLETLGVIVTTDVFKILEAEAQEMYGVKLIGVANPENSAQTMIDFDKTVVPEEVKKAAIASNEVKDKVIPEPNPELSEEEKMEVVRAIMAKRNSLGGNLTEMLKWAQKSFSMDKETLAVVLATVLSKIDDVEIMGLNGISNAVYGKFCSDHCIVGSHTLLKSWLQEIDDKEIAELVKVLISFHAERLVTNFNASNPKEKSTYESEFEIRNKRIQASIGKEIVTAILEKQKITNDEVDVYKATIDGEKSYKGLISAYGDSDSIVKDKLTEIIKYYNKPVDRLAKYVDKSAYSEQTKKLFLSMKLSNLCLTLFVVLFGGFIGFDPSTPTQTTNATPELVVYKFPEVAKEKSLALTIDLVSEKVTVGESSADATVTINKVSETKPVYITSKPVIKTVYVENKTMVNKLINKYAPLEIPKLSDNYQKINGNLNLSCKRYIRAINSKFEGHRKCYNTLFGFIVK